MVHRRNHRDNSSAVCKCKHADFWSSHKLFNNNFVTRVAKRLVFHNSFYGIKCFFKILRNKHAFAQCKAVCLDNDRERCTFKIFHCFLSIVKNFVAGSWNIVFFHEVFAENFACLNTCSFGIRAKTRYANFVQFVNATKSQRIVWCDNCKINFVVLSKSNNFVYIFCADVTDANSILSNTTIARQCINNVNVWVFFKFFDDCVFSAATTYNHKIHKSFPLFVSKIINSFYMQKSRWSQNHLDFV